MFDTKTSLLAAYLALAAVVLATPALMTLLGPTRSRATVSGWIPVLGGGALAGTCLLWSARGLPETFMSPAILALACLLVARKGSSLSATLGNGIGAGLFSTVTWWQLSPTLGPLNAVIFAAILIAALNIASDSTADRRLSPKAALSMLTGLGLAMTGAPASAMAGATAGLEAIRNFIRQGALRWRRPGWILEDQSDKGPWRDYFLDAYELSETLHFNGFTAYRLTPR